MVLTPQKLPKNLPKMKCLLSSYLESDRIVLDSSCIWGNSEHVFSKKLPKNKDLGILYVMGQTIFRSVYWLYREIPMTIKFQFY